MTYDVSQLVVCLLVLLLQILALQRVLDQLTITRKQLILNWLE